LNGVKWLRVLFCVERLGSKEIESREELGHFFSIPGMAL